MIGGGDIYFVDNSFLLPTVKEYAYSKSVDYCKRSEPRFF